MSQRDQEAGSARLRRALFRVLVVIGAAIAGTTAAWALTTGSAVAEDSPAGGLGRATEPVVDPLVQPIGRVLHDVPPTGDVAHRTVESVADSVPSAGTEDGRADANTSGTADSPGDSDSVGRSESAGPAPALDELGRPVRDLLGNVSDGLKDERLPTHHVIEGLSQVAQRDHGAQPPREVQPPPQAAPAPQDPPDASAPPAPEPGAASPPGADAPPHHPPRLDPTAHTADQPHSVRHVFPGAPAEPDIPAHQPFVPPIPAHPAPSGAAQDGHGANGPIVAWHVPALPLPGPVQGRPIPVHAGLAQTGPAHQPGTTPD